MAGGPTEIGFGVFAGVKLVGYVGAAKAFKWGYPESRHGAIKVGAARTPHRRCGGARLRGTLDLGPWKGVDAPGKRDYDALDLLLRAASSAARFRVGIFSLYLLDAIGFSSAFAVPRRVLDLLNLKA